MQEFADRSDATLSEAAPRSSSGWCARWIRAQQTAGNHLPIYEELLPDGSSRRTLCPFTLRFLWRNEAELMLQAAGFIVEHVWGDFEGATTMLPATINSPCQKRVNPYV